ncbi:MAG TPA: polysaccharide deacetylase family protein [Solirubrobacteraceae bacterium]|jgi:peptidoglycan/xylan/chitin deacetylase (PgdA/CDA1 family)|nr:polysaccharide deacetylase family protein [Solirubrobacteraceae bacterium]
MSSRPFILTFHGVGQPSRALDAGEADVWVDRARFLSILDWAAARKSVEITFDDGNASDLEQALPALRERGLRATFFVVAGRLGRPGFVDVDSLRELAAAGMEIGSHGMWHRPWSGLGEGELREEIVEAKALIEQLIHQPITRAACPFGAYDRRSLKALRSNYAHVYTSDKGTAHAAGFIQARNSVHASDTAGDIDAIATSRPSVQASVVRYAKQAVKRWR